MIQRQIFILLGGLLGGCLAGAAAPAAPSPYWPEFHGPRRDNIVRETGLLKSWPAEGPKLVWKFTEAGKGYACVSVAEGLLFTSGDFGNDEYVLALTLEGRLKWKTLNGKAWKGAQAGARTTPTYNDGLVYQLNAHGDLTAFAAQTGKVIWTVNVAEKFEADLGLWGYTENLVVEGNKVLCLPGGKKGRVVALDKKTGATLWANTELADRAGYSSPLIVDHNGARQFITLARSTFLGVDVATGKTLWVHDHKGFCDQNVTTPIYHEGTVYVTSGHKAGGRKVRLTPGSPKAEELWFQTDLDNCHGGVVLLDGYLYGSGCRLYQRGLMGVEYATGKTMFNAREIGKVSITYADGRLYCLGNDTTMALVDLSPREARIISRFKPPWENEPPCLSHPVVCGGRLYIRHLNELFCYQVGAD
jgi:outer membrane protein assembly factor BamB